MLDKIKQILSSWSNPGMKLPVAYDSGKDKPSVTLLFAWVTFFLACVSLIALNFTNQTLTAAIVGIIFWALATVIYRMRQIDHIKFDLEKKSLELEDTDNNNNEEKEK